jgi:hypothetical protein
MFLHDFTYVDLPAEAVRRRLLEGTGEWLGPLAVSAAEDGRALQVRIGPVAVPALSKVARVRLGQPYQRGDVTVVPMVWEATRVPAAFPVLEADLEVASLGPGTTQLSLLGRYQPPLGEIGERLDRLLLHRVAEASIRAFLRRLAESLGTTPAPA